VNWLGQDIVKDIRTNFSAHFEFLEWNILTTFLWAIGDSFGFWYRIIARIFSQGLFMIIVTWWKWLWCWFSCLHELDLTWIVIVAMPILVL
jgi:hypothetical protein